MSALRFFFTVTLDRPDLSRRFVIVHYPRKLPTVLSVKEVGRLLELAPGPKYRAALGTAYGAGLRVSEVATLKVGDINSTRMLIPVERARDARIAMQDTDHGERPGARLTTAAEHQQKRHKVLSASSGNGYSAAAIRGGISM